MPTLVIKVDIDTYRGMKEGVPGIVKVLGKYSAPASFFVSFGPDRAGLAVLQLLRPRFLKKMIRTNALGMYGLKTALYGTLLPPPMIGAGFPDTVKNLEDFGHEVACHAWDHRLWQDWLFMMTRKTIDTWFEKMVNAYVSITGKRPSGFGAPGWLMDERALKVAGNYGFMYLSCSRAKEPFIFEENGMLEIPSNLPCIEEVGVAGVLAAITENAESRAVQVLPVHAEVEGGAYREAFEQMLHTALSCDYSILTCIDAARDLEQSKLEHRALKRGMIPGRAFACAV